MLFPFALLIKAIGLPHPRHVVVLLSLAIWFMRFSFPVSLCNNLGSSSVDLRFVAKVDEENRFAAQRALTRALYLMFADNGVYVPFNQLVLSTRNDDTSDNKEKLDSAIKK